MTEIDTSGPSSNATGVMPQSEWSHGKMMLVSAGMGIGLAAIPLYTLGVFIEPLSRDMGWPSGAVVLAQSLTSLIVGLGSPLAGVLLDRWGARPMVLAGAALQSCAVASLALLPSTLWLYFAVWAVAGVGTVLASPIVWLRPVVERFVIQRGLAVSLVLCGSNIAGVITPMLTAYIMAYHGWRAAYLGLGLYMALTSLPLALIYLYDSKSLAKRAGGQVVAAILQNYGLTPGAAVRTRNFWIMVPSFFLAGLGITGYVAHLVPMLTQRGVAPLLAATAVSALAVSAIVGRLTAGYLMDRIFAPRIASFALFLPVLASAVMLFVPGSLGPGLVAAILIGLATGAELDMISYLVSQYFGMRSYGRMSGLMYGTFMLGCLIGPPLVVQLRTASGSFRSGQMALAAAFATASLILLLCSAFPTFTREQGQREET